MLDKKSFAVTRSSLEFDDCGRAIRNSEHLNAPYPQHDSKTQVLVWEGQQQNGVANRYSDVVIEFGLDLFQSLTLIFSYAKSTLLVLKHRSSYFFIIIISCLLLLQKVDMPLVYRISISVYLLQFV